MLLCFSGEKNCTIAFRETENHAWHILPILAQDTVTREILYFKSFTS